MIIFIMSTLLYTSTLITSFCFLLLLLPPASSLPPNSPRGYSSFEEKTRLGSTPPSCHNKCNGCHPCMAVQVPTLPSHKKFQPGFRKITNSMQFFHPSGDQYSNYKPLSWKCRCNNHFFNP